MITFKDVVDLHAADWADKIIPLHQKWSAKNDRVSGTPAWFDKGTYVQEKDSKIYRPNLNVVGVRFNLEHEANYGKYNDLLMLSSTQEDGSMSSIYLEVTVDPKVLRSGIAHLRQGSWNSYAIRPHRWESRTFPKIGLQPRWAICQDKNEVELLRTDGNGNARKNPDGTLKAFRDWAGINIHDNGGYKDSSLGCTVIKHTDSYVEMFLPMIYDIKRGKRVPHNAYNITYHLINRYNLEQYLKQ